MEEINNIIEHIEKQDNNLYPFFLLYRALRPDELKLLYTKNKLEAPCNTCLTPTPTECCNITASAHVSAGSKARVKSSWISTTYNPNIAALWASTKKMQNDSIIRTTGNSSSGLIAVIDPSGLIWSNPAEDPEIGITGKNAAKKSCEILIKDKIPGSNVIMLLQAEQVNKENFNNWIGGELKLGGKLKLDGKVYGSRTNTSSKMYVIYGRLTDSSILQYLEDISREELSKKFTGPKNLNGGSYKKKQLKNTKKTNKTKCKKQTRKCY